MLASRLMFRKRRHCSSSSLLLGSLLAAGCRECSSSSEEQMPVLAAQSGVAALATDPRCPPPSCCQGPEAGATGCFNTAFWTEAYCCPSGPAADCYRWGEDSPNNDLASYGVVSAFQCRHLCQSRPDCEYWSYLVDVPELGAQRGRCHLKSKEALASRQVEAHPFVVSGNRLCGHFDEGLTLEQAADRLARSGFTQVPWRTSPNLDIAWQAVQAGHAVAATAGSPSWTQEAAVLFNSLGFVAVLGALDTLKVKSALSRANQILDRVLQLDPIRMGNRGPRRYSFGALSPTHHLVHLPEWSQLLDVDAVNAVLHDIYPDGFFAVGGGGDLVLEDTSTYQSLHLDIGGPSIHEMKEPPGIAVNFLLEDLECTDGPTRVVAGTHRLAGAAPPPLPQEPRHLKEGTLLCPLPAGTAIVRDLRAWHGGTPSGATKPRLMPNTEYVSQEYGSMTCGMGVILDPCKPVLPRQLFDGLSPFARGLTSHLVTDELKVSSHSDLQEEWILLDPIDFLRHSAEVF